MKAPIIVSLGGSIVVPDSVDAGFLRAFRDLILTKVKEGERFFIIVGGGKTCRRYQEAARALGVSEIEQLDWVGIYSTRFNAEFVRIVFGDVAAPEIVIVPEEVTDSGKAVTFGAGGVPGHSTDFDAVVIAGRLKAERMVNLSNIDYVYDKDPRQFPDARKIEKTIWADFRKQFPFDSYNPGINAPFDPVAAKRAEELGLEVAIMNGKNLENFKNYLEGEEFKGTVIK